MYLHQLMKVNEVMKYLNWNIHVKNVQLHHRFHHLIDVKNKDVLKLTIMVILMKDNNQIHILIYMIYQDENSVENH